jgi:hypothetical protein
MASSVVNNFTPGNFAQTPVTTFDKAVKRVYIETMKTTKKAFREHLNQQDLAGRKAIAEAGSIVDPLHRNGRYQQRTRLYGDYLYSQDRAMFDHEFEQWKAGR